MEIDREKGREGRGGNERSRLGEKMIQEERKRKGGEGEL